MPWDITKEQVLTSPLDHQITSTRKTKTRISFLLKLISRSQPRKLVIFNLQTDSMFYCEATVCWWNLGIERIVYLSCGQCTNAERQIDYIVYRVLVIWWSNGEVKTCSFVMSHGTQRSSIALTTFATLSNKRNQWGLSEVRLLLLWLIMKTSIELSC